MTLVANIGVVAGIVFLAFEIRVNTDALRSEAAAEYLSDSMELSSDLGRDSETITMIARVNADGWTTEANRLGFIANAQFKAVEFAYVQWNEGNLDADLWNGNNRATYDFLWDQHWMRELWPWLRGGYSKEFQQHMDQMILDICSRRECRGLPDWMAQPHTERNAAIQAWSARFEGA